MRKVRMQSWMIAAGMVGLLGAAIIAPAQAGVAVKWGQFEASTGDVLTGASTDGDDRYVLRPSSIKVRDIEALQEAQKVGLSELQSLKSKVEGQDRAFEEFKRKDGSSTSSNDSQVASLKRALDEQKSTIDRQKSEIEGLKRSLDDLKRNVDTLSSKVK
ncbi:MULTISPECIES: hypothetical protein [unclassified Pseudomonas]|uniref:hypothetical protein n=1 Tax=unclassified Pseudomonas TaxID=196821 RepID=UPI002788BD70|nr:MULTISPECIES: hypothetical protein [unclassified Pseudomonas]MDQ0740308.1 hypothetical protein [Pseudomonas sp. W4I3]WPN90290.1 hypothetical protein SC319_13495 [Pseudomonas sp. MUP56]WPN95814.1 hypothetical protein SC318_13495 [Pseudomonas sp. MUP55]